MTTGESSDVAYFRAHTLLQGMALAVEAIKRGWWGFAEVLSAGCKRCGCSELQRGVQVKPLIFLLAFGLSGCGILSDIELVCDGEEEVREDGKSREKYVRGATASLKKNLLGKPESLTVESKTWATYKGKFQYESQPGYYVFQEGDPNGTESSISLKPTNGKMLLIRRQGGELVFAADYICTKAAGVK